MLNNMKKIIKFSDYHVSGIYAIRNLLNGKIYVGSSSDICERIRIHKRDLRASKHHSIHLQRSWKLYGENSFEFFLVELVEDVSCLLEREQYWMDESDCYNKHKGYNISPTAGSCRGIKLSEEHKEKIRIAHLGKAVSKETRKKLSEIHKRNPYWGGRSHSQKTKDKISLTKTGEKHSRSTCNKRNSSIRKGGSRNGKHKGVSWDNTRSKWIAQIRVSGKIIRLGQFSDPKVAAENYDFHTKSLFPEAFLNFSDKDYSNFVPKRII